MYINTCKTFAKDISNKEKYQHFLEVVDLIIEYSNGYGEGIKENNFYDWLMILPINISVAMSGFFAGIQTRKNMAVIRAYKVLLEQILQETVEKLDELEMKNE